MYLESVPTPEQYASAPYPENINAFKSHVFLVGTNIDLSTRISPNRILPMGILPQTFRRSIRNSLCIMVHNRTIRNVSSSSIKLILDPFLNNSIAPIKEFHLAKIIERLLKLSTVSLVAWLAGFFCIFHSMFNALAEVMHFADRKFYDAWWNSGSVGDVLEIVESSCA